MLQHDLSNGADSPVLHLVSDHGILREQVSRLAELSLEEEKFVKAIARERLPLDRLWNASLPAN